MSAEYETRERKAGKKIWLRRRVRPRKGRVKRHGDQLGLEEYGRGSNGLE